MAKSRRTAFLLVKIAVSGGLAWFFYRRVAADQLLETLSSITPGAMAPLLLILLFNSFISTVKWRIFLQASGLQAPLGRLYSTYLAASFLNIFLPSNVGGDFYRIYDAGKNTRDAGRSTASVLADRISGFLAIVIFGLVAVVAGLGTASSPALAIVPIVVFSALVIMIAMIYQQTFLMGILKLTGLARFEKLVMKLEAFFQAFQEYKTHPKLFSKVMGISFLFQFMVIVFVAVMAGAVGLDIPFALFCIYVPLIGLLEAIPVGVYGVGFREIGYVLLMKAAAQPDEQGLTLSLLYVILTLLYSSVGGIILAVRHLRGQKKETE